MSLRATLESAVEAGRLCHLVPEFGEREQRSLLMHPDFRELFLEHHARKPIGRMQAALENIVTGGRVTMSMTPYSHDKFTMGLDDPPQDGTWEIRCCDPSPAVRVFGRFACQNVFVALEWWPRSKPIPGIDRRPLGHRNSNEWHMALGETDKRWKEIFPNLTPLIGKLPSDYFSENAFAERD